MWRTRELTTFMTPLINLSPPPPFYSLSLFWGLVLFKWFDGIYDNSSFSCYRWKYSLNQLFNVREMNEITIDLQIVHISLSLNHWTKKKPNQIEKDRYGIWSLIITTFWSLLPLFILQTFLKSRNPFSSVCVSNFPQEVTSVCWSVVDKKQDIVCKKWS